MMYWTYGILVIYCGHVLVLKVEWKYNTYEIYVGGRFDFELEMLGLVENLIYTVEYVFYGKKNWKFGCDPYLVVVDGN